jgi:hydroxymethylbilane synthase
LSASAPFTRIGTRASPLALAQAHQVRALLATAHGVSENDIAITAFRTTGDRITDRPLSEAGGKGLFTKELEEALLAGTIDLAVHSSKDMPGELPDGLVLDVFLEREDVRDAFISLSAPGLAALPSGSRLGTSSLRRAAQMKRYRPDLAIVPFRGNVGTRLDKLANGVADATLLAVAGLNRLGQAERITQYLDPLVFPPAPAQGAIGIEIRAGDDATTAIVAPLHDAPTGVAVRAERAFLIRLEGSCRTPIAAYTRQDGATLTLLGQVLTPDGTEAYSATMTGSTDRPEALGTTLADALLREAGPDFLKRVGI